MLEREAEICRHANGGEEEAEQQALEGLDIGLQFVPVFGFREQHASREGAKRHGKAAPARQRRGARDDEQRDGGEDLRRLRTADRAKHPRHDQPAAEQDGGDDTQTAQHLKPGQAVGHRAAGQELAPAPPAE